MSRTKLAHGISGPPKKCSRCRQIKALSEYGRSKAELDGINKVCKKCHNLQSKTCKANTKLGIYQKDLLATGDPDTKFCAKCKQELPLAAFGLDSRLSTGRRSYCRKCEVIVSVENKSKLREKIGEVACSHKDNIVSLKTKYGITEANFQDLMNQQKGCCAICEVDFGELNRKASVDHDHTTGLVRGLLCTHCNTAIGYANDNTGTLLNAATYLANHARKGETLIGQPIDIKQQSSLSVHHRIIKGAKLNWEHRRNMQALKCYYGITEADYQELMNQQKGCCAICEADFSSLDKRASIDHDHTTGLVRGLLCQNCNATLGHANDNIGTLLNAAMYLTNQPKEKKIAI